MNILEELVKFTENEDAYLDNLRKDFARMDLMLLDIINEIIDLQDTKKGKFVGNDTMKMLAEFERKVETFWKENMQPFDKFIDYYNGSFKEYVSFSERLNDIEIAKKGLNEYQKIKVESLTENIKNSGYRNWFVEPMKTILVNNVATGQSVTNTRKLFSEWISQNKNTISGTEVRSLERYAAQVCFDAVYQSNGFIQQTIKDDFGFKFFVYNGNLVKDSRELCQHLIKNNGGIWEIKEIPKLLNDYPQGTIKGTDTTTFFINRGGYACRHRAFAVRNRDTIEKLT